MRSKEVNALHLINIAKLLSKELMTIFANECERNSCLPTLAELGVVNHFNLGSSDRMIILYYCFNLHFLEYK